ncbi:MAG: hypothetical protein M3Y17_08520, partial [Actinomycetota bacterium]|nr:hypothetical protein [Actinomycetota bacterium]
NGTHMPETTGAQHSILICSRLREEQLVLWSRRVAEHYRDSVAVAVSRLLSSARERSFSAEDSLIDAVIAWENLAAMAGTPR